MTPLQYAGPDVTHSVGHGLAEHPHDVALLRAALNGLGFDASPLAVASAVAAYAEEVSGASWLAIDDAHTAAKYLMDEGYLAVSPDEAGPAHRELGTTPGPWRYDDLNYVWGPSTEMVADVDHWPDGGPIGQARGYGEGLPQDRNARLLAAAPELYDALADLLDSCPADLTPAWQDALAVARALRQRLRTPHRHTP